MANLLEVAQIIFNQIEPNPSDESAVQFEEVAASVKLHYALEQYYLLRQQRIDDWWMLVPSHLLSESDDLEVIDDEIDISELKVLRSMPNETWLQAVGQMCACRYVKSTINQTQLLCDDDSLPESDKPYYVVGKKIKFPKGVNDKKLKIIYANDGSTLDGSQEIDDVVAALVRIKVLEIYQGKTSKEDVTNNSNSQL